MDLCRGEAHRQVQRWPSPWIGRSTGSQDYFEAGTLHVRGQLSRIRQDRATHGQGAEGRLLSTIPRWAAVHIREIVFMDTPDFRLYNNAFILRRRIAYVDGFPVGDPEIVFKFRHPDEMTAASVDVRPNVAGKYQIKFKAEALPLKDEIGGFRILYSQSCQFGLSQMHAGDRFGMWTLATVFPALAVLKNRGGHPHHVCPTSGGWRPGQLVGRLPRAVHKHQCTERRIHHRIDDPAAVCGEGFRRG